MDDPAVLNGRLLYRLYRTLAVDFADTDASGRLVYSLEAINDNVWILAMSRVASATRDVDIASQDLAIISNTQQPTTHTLLQTGMIAAASFAILRSPGTMGVNPLAPLARRPRHMMCVAQQRVQ